MPPRRDAWHLTANIVQRGAALTCLLSAYGAAITGFVDLRWVAGLALSALVVATAPSHWSGGDGGRMPRLAWPAWGQLGTHFAPGWLLMIGAAVGKALGVTPYVATLIWFAGSIWLVIGAWLASRSLPRLPAPRSVWLWAAAVVAVATALRAWHMDTVPRYVHHDETVLTRYGLRFLTERLDWFTVQRDAGDFINMPLAYIPAGFGVWIGGFNLFWARLPDVILGILSVWLLFDGLWRVSTTRLAVVAALLLATSHTHVAFSRIASTYITTAFVVSLLFALLSRLWTAPTYVSAVLLGIAGVLGIQTYLASLPTLPLLLGCVVMLAVLQPRRWRAVAAPLAIGAVSAVCAAGVYAVAVAEARDVMFNRHGSISMFAPAQMAELRQAYHTDSAAVVVARKAWSGLQAFHFGRDMCEQYGIDRPLADSYSAALLIAGAVLALAHLRGFVPINAFVVTAGFLIFSIGWQHSTCHNRATGALPLGMVFPAIALVQCCSVLWEGRRWLWRGLRALSMAAILVLVARENVDIYFRYYTGSLGWGTDHAEAAWLAREYADRYTVHLVSWSFKYGPWDSQRLILADLPVERNDTDSDAAYIADVPLTGSDLFIVSGQVPASRDALLARFPQARVEIARRHPEIGPLLYLVFVGEPRARAPAT